MPTSLPRLSLHAKELALRLVVIKKYYVSFQCEQIGINSVYSPLCEVNWHALGISISITDSHTVNTRK